MPDRQKELRDYRLQQAEETLTVAKTCISNEFYKDSINRSYYSVFYAIKAVLALGTVDFKRHKDVVAHFNKKYVATEKFPRELGRKIGNLKQIREEADYDDFYIASKEEAEGQIKNRRISFAKCKRIFKSIIKQRAKTLCFSLSLEVHQILIVMAKPPTK